MLNSVFSFIIALGVLVFLHEFGHYSVARLCKVTVVQFSVGFGRPILSWTNRKTGVLWTLGWIPLGGYVRMLDERDPDSVKGQTDLSNAFNRQHVSKRIAIVLAGPVANLLVAWFLYTALALSQSNQIAPVPAQPLEGTAAHAVGLQSNDRVIQINGERTADWQSVSWELLATRLFGDDLTLKVEREGQAIDLGPLPADQMDVEFSSRLPFELGFSPMEKRVIVASVQPDSPASLAGIQSRDVLLRLDDQNIESSAQFTADIRDRADKPSLLTVERDGAELTLSITPEQVQGPNGDPQGRLGIGVGGERLIEPVSNGLLTSISQGADRMIQVSVMSLTALGNMITGDMSWKHLNGPVAIASAAGDSSSLGILPFIAFLAMLSVSLGILNLLPIPVLDGGHLLYYFAEIVMGRPVSEAWMVRGQKIGILLIGLLTCVAFFNDIQRLL